MVRAVLRPGGSRRHRLSIVLMERSLVYFVSDVHLGLEVGDPKERERRFVGFLKGIDPERTEALYLLGDIWDFWYEYHDVVPKEGARVVAQLFNLQDAGVKIFFMSGNHDIWFYRWFEEQGFIKLRQPYRFRLGSYNACIGHGDSLGGSSFGYGLMLSVFRNRVCQALFSALHPRLAFAFAKKTSLNGRGKHSSYEWKGSEEALYRYADAQKADVCIFGHYHTAVDCALPSGGRLIVLDDWIDGGTPYLEFNLVAGSFTFGGSLPKMEK